MSAPSEAADAQRMLAAMCNSPIRCFTCRHGDAYKVPNRWCSKIQNKPPGDIFQIAATCPHFLWKRPDESTLRIS